MPPRPLNYTTTIDVRRTVAEVQQMLGEHGADAVHVTYRDREPVGVGFSLAGPHGTRTFGLPVDVDAVERLLVAEGKKGTFKKQGTAKLTSREQAARVAWRTAQDWMEAQLAMVAAQMASLDQVMLPYLHVDDDRTLYEAYREREQTALMAGG